MADALMKAYVQFRADSTGLKQDAEAQVKAATQGLSATVNVELDQTRLDRQRADLQAKLKALGAQAASIRANLDVNDKDGLAKVAGFQVRLAALDKRVASPKITLDGIDRAEAQMLTLDAQMSRERTANASAIAMSAIPYCSMLLRGAEMLNATLAAYERG